MEKGYQHSRVQRTSTKPHCLAPGLEPGKINLTLEGDKEKKDDHPGSEAKRRLWRGKPGSHTPPVQ